MNESTQVAAVERAPDAEEKKPGAGPGGTRKEPTKERTEGEVPTGTNCAHIGCN